MGQSGSSASSLCRSSGQETAEFDRGADAFQGMGLAERLVQRLITRRARAACAGSSVRYWPAIRACLPSYAAADLL